ncbi:MAG: hypothetical protein JW750_07450 [Anaerolineaceae bacterium]|nr:hypothetical protein [Anaerolineaceae bacterium]
MNRAYNYQIRVEGVLPEHWGDWFGGLSLENDPNGESTLSGVIVDQSALLGVLIHLHGLNLPLISVIRDEISSPTEQKSR